MAATISAVRSHVTMNKNIPKTINMDASTKKKLFLAKNGYIGANKLCETLQGSIWLAKEESTDQRVAIKIALRELVNKSTARRNGKEIKISEDIKSEALLLKFVSQDPNCPNSIAKFLNFFKSRSSYYLVMEDGGNSLFQFICSAHKLLKSGHLNVHEWHKLVKIIFKQMVECIEYLHSLNICHMDISLENFLISKVEILTYTDPKGREKVIFPTLDKVQVKLCDFGLATIFPKSKGNECKSYKFVGKRNYMSPELIARKEFDAKSNDIWCLSVCLFMMIIGGGPVHIARMSDSCFVKVIKGEYMKLLKIWDRIDYVNDDLLELFKMTLIWEKDRATIEEIKQCSWLKDNRRE